jgi:hypothetical protein
MFAAILCCVLIGSDAGAVVLDRPVPKLLIGKPFEEVLDNKLTASWTNVPMRGILQRISANYEISILLDRRLDPSRELQIDLDTQPLAAAVHQIAERQQGSTSVVGNTIYVGPTPSAARLRTLVQLRADELFALESDAAQGRKFKLADRRTIHWNDLDEPADILSHIVQLYELRVEGGERIPHDLWAGATLPSVNAFEALSLVLVQFDLTFAWIDDARGIRLQPIPDDVSLTRSYTPRGRPLRTPLQQWQEAFPGLRGEVVGGAIVVRGRLEQHEALADSLRPASSQRRVPRPATTGPAPLERRQFTLKIENVPARALIERLEMSDIVFKYDARELAAAGIDLNKTISLDVTKAPPDEFFHAVLDQLGLEFTIDNLTVTMKPKR